MVPAAYGAYFAVGGHYREDVGFKESRERDVKVFIEHLGEMKYVRFRFNSGIL